MIRLPIVPSLQFAQSRGYGIGPTSDRLLHQYTMLVSTVFFSAPRQDFPLAHYFMMMMMMMMVITHEDVSRSHEIQQEPQVTPADAKITDPNRLELLLRTAHSFVR